MKSQLLVSIIINNYNYGCFVADAIDSALNQTYSPVEVIVVDDGSTDNSREVINSYGDRIVSVVKENGGQASAFNAGFTASRGDIICFLDSDDTFLEHKVDKIVQILTGDLDIGWCFHPLMLVDKNTQAILGKTTAFASWSPVKASNKCDLRLEMKSGRLSVYLPATSGLCFRRSLLEKILPMPVTSIKTHADLYLRSASTWLSPGYMLTEALTSQGIHSCNSGTRVKHEGPNHAIGIVTAYHLRSQFPEIKKFSNRMFARNLSAYWKNKWSNPEYKTFIKQYFAMSSLPETSNIYLKAVYYRLPFRKKYTHQLSKNTLVNLQEAKS